MSEQGESSGTDQPDSNLNQESVASFRDRALNRLEREGGESEIPAETQEQSRYEDFRQDRNLEEAHQPDDNDSEDSDQEQTDGQLTEGVEDSDVEDDKFADTSIEELRQRVTEAEERHDLMQSDYTQKTQKLGESRKELLTSLDQSQRIAAVYVERANTQLKRYENVNWQQLQSTLDPQKYNQRVAEYRQVVGVRDRAVNEHEQIKQFSDQQVERAKSDQAEISRDILKTTVPGWGNDLYGSLRDHAVSNLNFSTGEFDEITDYRIIKLIHTNWKITNTGKTVRQIQQGNQPNPPGGGNKARPRGADGKFRNAQQHHLANPGNRDATRNAFQQRLRKERTGRRP